MERSHQSQVQSRLARLWYVGFVRMKLRTKSGVQIALHAIAGHLLVQNGDAAIIDTTGSFSPLRLRDVICNRLRAERQSDPSVSAMNDQTDQDRVNSMLDRVKVMRVFDFAGMTEAIGEIAEVCEQGEMAKSAKPKGVGQIAANEVPSSQDDEMEGMNEIDDRETEQDHVNSANPGIGMIVIDNIANVLQPELSKNQVQGLPQYVILPYSPKL